MRPLKYSINITLDGCCDHRAGTPDEHTHRHATETIARADAIILGRVTYQMMEDAWRWPVAPGIRPAWMEPFGRAIDEVRKYVVSTTIPSVDWNAELIRTDLADTVRRLKDEPGNGLYTGGLALPLALAELGLIDEYEFIVHPRIAGHGPTLFAGLTKHLDLELIDRFDVGPRAVAMRYRPVG